MVAIFTKDSTPKEWMTFKELSDHYNVPVSVIYDWYWHGHMSTSGWLLWRAVHRREFERVYVLHGGELPRPPTRSQRTRQSRKPQIKVGPWIFDFSIQVASGLVVIMIAVLIGYLW